jgi:MFS transporter, putative metabolite:H+ symporter
VLRIAFRDYRKRTVMLVIFQVLQTVAYYGFGTLAPLVLVSKGFEVTESLGYAALTFVGYPLGSLISVPLVERFERKHLIIASVLGIGLCGIVFAASTNVAVIVAAGFLLTAVSNIFSNSFHIYQAEIFPTAIRSTASGVCYFVVTCDLDRDAIRRRARACGARTGSSVLRFGVPDRAVVP